MELIFFVLFLFFWKRWKFELDNVIVNEKQFLFLRINKVIDLKPKIEEKFVVQTVSSFLWYFPQFNLFCLPRQKKKKINIKRKSSENCRFIWITNLTGKKYTRKFVVVVEGKLAKKKEFHSNANCGDYCGVWATGWKKNDKGIKYFEYLRLWERHTKLDQQLVVELFCSTRRWSPRYFDIELSDNRGQLSRLELKWNSFQIGEN